MKKLLLSLCIVLTAVFSAKALVYTVTVPDGTKACYIAGDMTGWAQMEMDKVTDTQYTIDIPAATEANVYKYCSGPNWNYVEMQADGVSDVVNRTYSASDAVATWKAVYTPPAVITHTFSIDYGVEGDTWEKVSTFTKNDDGTYSASFIMPDNSADNYKFWVGYSNDGSVPGYGGQSNTADMSSMSGYSEVAAGDQVIVTVDPNSSALNWGITIMKDPSLGINGAETSDVKYFGLEGAVKASFDGTASVEVYTATGKLVGKTNATNEAVFSNLVNGLYLVKVNNQVAKVLVK